MSGLLFCNDDQSAASTNLTQSFPTARTVRQAGRTVALSSDIRVLNTTTFSQEQRLLQRGSRGFRMLCEVPRHTLPPSPPA